MKSLPETVVAYKKTPTFTDADIPEAMLNTHATKSGVWGVLNIVKGSVAYCIDNEAEEKYKLQQDDKGVIEPTVSHHLEFSEPFELYIEFYK